MAIVKYGHLISEARGKLNGSVFSRNAYGSYMRTKVSPSNPQSQYQSMMRLFFTNASQKWGSLSEDKRSGWNSIASTLNRTNVFGDNAPLSGYNLYVSCNVNRQLVGLSLLEPVPVMVNPMGLSKIQIIELTNEEFTIEISPPNLPAGNYIVLIATAPMPPGRSYAKNDFRVLLVKNSPQQLRWAILPDYISRFGAPIPGKKIFIGAYVIQGASGLSNVAVMTQGIVEAG